MSAVRFTVYVDPYRRKWFRDHRKPTPLALLLMKYTSTGKNAEALVTRQPTVKGTVKSITGNQVVVSTSYGNVTATKPPDVSLSANQSVVVYKRGTNRLPAVYPI